MEQDTLLATSPRVERRRELLEDDISSPELEHTHRHSSPLLTPVAPKAPESSTEAVTHEIAKESPIEDTRPTRSFYIVFLVLLYSSLAITTWAILCTLTDHPLTTKRYGIKQDGELDAYGFAGATAIHARYERNQQWLQATQVLRSLAAVLALPLVTATCTKAVVAFSQGPSHSQLTLRQTMALADRAWSDPYIYGKLVTGNFKKYGTKLLIGAIALNLLGAIVFPLQAFYLTTETIKTPTFPGTLIYLRNMLDAVDDEALENNLLTVVTRSAITSTALTSPQARLWTGEKVECIFEPGNVKTLPMSCVVNNGMSLGNISTLPDPFLAQLPAGFNTGLHRQFLPRINSTASRVNVTASDYPSNCDTAPGSFFARFGSTTPLPPPVAGWGNWSLEACMPANLTHSPWTNTQKRQDFTEELFLNISLLSNDPMAYFEEPWERGGLFKITLKTTAGYFELPNYANDGQPGPLLDDVEAACDEDCWRQGVGSKVRVRRDTYESDFSEIANSSYQLQQRSSRGPLATIILALFGEGSFIARRLERPEGFMFPNLTSNEARSQVNYYNCIDQVPLMALLRSDSGARQIGNVLEPCARNDVSTHDDIQRQVTSFVRSLYWNDWDHYAGERITNAFTAAAFLANEAWLMQDFERSWTVHYDLGADTTIPVISTTGKIVVWALLGTFLSALLLLAFYSALTPRWTDQLDAFALLRIGSALGDSIHLKLAHRADKVEVLDRLPGWVGNVKEGDTEISQLGLGAGGGFTGRIRLQAHSTV